MNQGYSSTLNMPDNAYEKMNNNVHFYGPHGQMGPTSFGQVSPAPFGQMVPGGVPMNQPNVVINQGSSSLNLLRSEQLGACSVSVQCPHCHQNIDTISSRKFNCKSCLFRVIITILIIL